MWHCFSKAPPPPPPSSSPPLRTILRPPPPPPSALQAQPTVRFIPHQIQRQPPRPPSRPNFIGMRGPPITSQASPFPPPGHMGPFIPPMSVGPPMPQVGHMAPGAPIHHGGTMLPSRPMHHGPPMHPPGPMHHMQMPSCPPMPLPMNMGVSLPVPPGFYPPMGAPAQFDTTHFDPPSFTSSNGPQVSEAEVPVPSSTESSSETTSVVASAPAIYAAPFVKSHPENISESMMTSNGHETISTTVASPVALKTEKTQLSKMSQEQSVGPAVISTSGNEETVVTKKKEKKKKIVRMAGGQAWEDNSLQEWETDDFRIFCGDLGNDVTDEVLIRAFSKYPSFVKAKVIRDKRTNKTKGFGFVSFKDPQDFIKAMREMNGRYVGSRPIKLRKSTWRDRNIECVKKKQREKEKLGLL